MPMMISFQNRRATVNGGVIRVLPGIVQGNDLTVLVIYHRGIVSWFTVVCRICRFCIFFHRSCICLLNVSFISPIDSLSFGP